MTASALSELQVEMDPVRLAVACMALSLQNAALREELARLKAGAENQAVEEVSNHD